MAKDLEFESERYEKRQNAKRYLYPAIGILVILVIAVGLTLLLRGRRAGAFTGGEDTPYPYTWTVNRNGTALLELDHAASPGYVWAETSPSGGMTVTARESKENSTLFTLTPEGEGRRMLHFVLRGEADPSDCIYELHFLTETVRGREHLEAGAVSAAGNPLQAVIRGGEEGAWPYSIRTDADGDLAITIRLPQMPASDAAAEAAEAGQAYASAPDAEWTCGSGDEAVALPLGVIYGDEEIVCYFRPGGTAGTANVTLKEETTGACITAELENSGGSSLRVLSHGITAP